MSEEITNKLPPNKADKRYTRASRINELRTRAWHNFVKLKSGNKKNGVLAKAFGNSQTAWDGYEKKGRQPNDILIKKVEMVFPGSGEIYFFGPDGMKLWVALTTKDARELYVIKKVGQPLEREIVRFRMAAIEGKIPLQIDLYLTRKDPFDLKLESIKKGLNEKIGFNLSELAATILYDEMRIYKEIQFTDYMNDLADYSTYTKEVTEKMILEGEYMQIVTGGVKNKGAKTEEKITTDSEKQEANFIRSELRLPALDEENNSEEMPF